MHFDQQKNRVNILKLENKINDYVTLNEVKQEIQKKFLNVMYYWRRIVK